MRKSHVYVLHRGDGVPFYVGCTNDPERRLRQHRRSRDDDMVFLQIAATFVDEVTGFRAERICWESLKALGHALENTQPYGFQHLNLTPEQRSKAGKAGGRATGAKNLTAEQRARGGHLGGKAGGRNGAAAVNAISRQCPHCEMVSNPGAIGRHIKCQHPRLLKEPKTRHYKLPAELVYSGIEAIERELADRGVPVYDELGSQIRFECERGYPTPCRIDSRGRVSVATVLWEE